MKTTGNNGAVNGVRLETRIRERGAAGLGWLPAAALLLLAVSAWGCSGAEGVESPRPAATVSQADPQPAGAEWARAGGHITPGVRLYFGPAKTFVGVVLDEKAGYLDLRNGTRYDGVKLRTVSGFDEWSRRSAITEGDWYVRRDDPALSQVAARSF